jgi:hypothetical protein
MNTAHETEAPRSQRLAVNLTVVRPHLPRLPAGVRDQRAEHHRRPHDEHAKHGGGYTLRIPATPATFSVAARHWGAGIKYAALAVAAAGTAAFLASEVSVMPELRTRIVLVALVCALVGLVMLHLAVRDLFGRLRVDSQGLRWSPWYSGFVIPWKDLQSWNFDGFAFQFRTVKKALYDLERDLLTTDDQERLHILLSSCAAEKCLDAGTTV